jgi:hypothetical protein
MIQGSRGRANAPRASIHNQKGQPQHLPMFRDTLSFYDLTDLKRIHRRRTSAGLEVVDPWEAQMVRENPLIPANSRTCIEYRITL